jgi:hypothetical protein
MNGPVRLIVLMWVSALAIVTYGHYRNGGTGLPPASGYTGSALTYSLLGGLAQIPAAGPLAGMFAVAWTFQLFLRVNGTELPVAGSSTSSKKAAA